ncbi:nicolin-1-like isoform X2 [Lineus longissimus]|uniref:nicolin-1-like isoform X2 n=1 Tax=Lineus longissimus TaxID=88925 RepID=UPI002B4F3F62
MTSQGQVPVNCVVKSPVHIKIGDYKTEFHSGCAIMDIKFPNVFRVEVGEIVFRNYYTASVTVKAREKGTMIDGAGTKWRTLVRNMTLMPYPHCEENSQSYFTIKKKQMLFDPAGINGLRFILRQPSPVWKEFKLEEVKIYKSTSQDLPDVHIPPWVIKQLVDKDKDEKVDGEDEEEETKHRTKSNEIKYIEGVPHIDVVTEGLQQLWAMTQQVKAAQTRTALGRYDVDGSYEINLLSYT